MKIVIAGKNINYISSNHEVVTRDFWSFEEAVNIAKEVLDNKYDRAIFLSDYGLENMAISKLKGAIVAQVVDEYTAVWTRLHNNSSMITIPLKIISEDYAKHLIDLFLSGEYEGGRHNIRINMLNKMA